MDQIAVCDNDESDLQFLTAQIREYLAAHSILQGNICAFHSSRALKESLDAGMRYRLFLLDILMPGLDGIQIGRAIRAGDENVPIIYITSSREYALNAFQNHALRYLVKPVRQAELFSALDFAFRFLGTGEGKTYTVKTRDGIVSLQGRDIVVAENKYRSVLYTLCSGACVKSVSLRGTFEDAVAPLPVDPDFTRPHKSYYVNMRYIRTLQPGTILLDSGRQIPVSRSCCVQVNRDYLRFLSQEEGHLL